MNKPTYNVEDVPMELLQTMAALTRRAVDANGKYIPGEEITGGSDQFGLVLGDVGFWASRDNSQSTVARASSLGETAMQSKEPLVRMLGRRSFGEAFELFITRYNAENRAHLAAFIESTPEGLNYYVYREDFRFGVGATVPWYWLHKLHDDPAAFIAGVLYRAVTEMLESSYTEGESSKYYCPKGARPQLSRLLL